ncbi:MAG: hypothetical protein KAX49_04010 [Halanaerobiales bacterium]|nr:hypothetical protein [Halanaerobiales bacterium]
MKFLQTIFAIGYSDFLQRIRRYSFLVTIGLTIIAGINLIPARDSKFGTLNFSGYRGIYNSAWIGALMALLTSFILALFGFYIIKDTLERDKETGVGQIIATTPISKTMYIFGKFIGNVIILTMIAILMVIMGGVMQYIRGEALSINLWLLMRPFLLITFPTLIFISALSLLFENVPILRTSFGNIIYFFIWISAFIPIVKNIYFLDLIGGTSVIPQMIKDCQLIYPEYHGGFTLLGQSQTVGTFVWDGIDWTGQMILLRMGWVIVVFGLLSLSTLLFKRFDYTQENRKNSKEMIPIQETVQIKEYIRPQLFLPRIQLQNNFCRLLVAEIKIDLMGKPWWWYFITAIILILSGTLSYETAFQWILPIAWLWPINIWSRMGVREIKSRITQIVFSTKNIMPWQLMAEFGSGFIVAVLFATPVIVRSMILGYWVNLIYITIGALFISTLAFFLGVWSKSSKAFEVLYILYWYLGPINKVGVLDYTGSAMGNNLINFGVFYLPLIGLMMFLIVCGRYRQFRFQ